MCFILFPVDAEDAKRSALTSAYVVIGIGAAILVVASIIIILLVTKLRKYNNTNTPVRRGNTSYTQPIIQVTIF